jgi:short-subunit dehydrogenase
MVDVKGKWGLVTGGARGIGALVVGFLAEQGMSVIVQSRSPDHTQTVIDKYRKTGVGFRSIAADLQKPEQVKDMLDEIDAFGVDVDFVFNNAGVLIAYR